MQRNAQLDATLRQRTRLLLKLSPALHIGIISHNIPIDRLPPALRKRPLSAGPTGPYAIISYIDVFPGIDAQDGSQINAAGREVLRSASIGAQPSMCTNRVHRRRAHQSPNMLRYRPVVLGVHIDVLAAVMCAGIRAAGEVGGEEGVLLVAGLDQPDESRAKHGCGGDDELLLEGGDGGEGCFKIFLERGGHRCWVWGEAGEEEGVVVRH